MARPPLGRDGASSLSSCGWEWPREPMAGACALMVVCGCADRYTGLGEGARNPPPAGPGRKDGRSHEVRWTADGRNCQIWPLPKARVEASRVLESPLRLASES